MMRIRSQERRRRSTQARRVAEQKKFVADMMLIAGATIITLGLIGLLIMFVLQGQ